MALVIIASILALLALLLFQRIGVAVKYGPQGLEVTLRVSFIKKKIYPSPQEKPKKKKKTKKAKKAAKTAKPAAEDQKKERKLTPNKIKLLVRLGFKTLDKFLRALRFERFFISVVYGFEDCSKTAKYYGHTTALICIFYPKINSYLNIKRRELFVDMDFCAAKTVFNADISLSVSIRKILAIGIGAGMRALLIYFKKTKK